MSSSIYPRYAGILIDSHCHLDFAAFDSDLETVLSAAKGVGVSGFIVPGVTAESWARLLATTQAHAEMHPALGLHPCFLAQHQSVHLEYLENLLATENLCALGEIGLDLFIPEADLEAQLYFLRPQLRLAVAHQLPVILHVRKAHDLMLKELRPYAGRLTGVVHGFSGSEQQAKQYVQLGYKLGIGGTLTYSRAKKLHRVVQQLPLDSFVLETDAPDMPLANYRGQRNEPARILEVAQALATLTASDLEQVMAVTSRTACKLFGLSSSVLGSE